MGKTENLDLLSEATERLISFVKDNPHYHKSHGMGQSLLNYVEQLERDLHKKRRRYKVYAPGTIVYVHFGMNFGEEFSKTHYAITLSKNDRKDKRTITVIPLTSKPGKDKLKLDFEFSRELFYLTYEVATKSARKINDELLEEINSVLPDNIAPITDITDMPYLFENIDKYYDTLKSVYKKTKKSTELLEKASEQMDRFQKSLEKTTYAALDCITTIDKNKIEPRTSEIDVLSATVVGDRQLRKLSDAISERIIFDN